MTSRSPGRRAARPWPPPGRCRSDAGASATRSVRSGSDGHAGLAEDAAPPPDPLTRPRARPALPPRRDHSRQPGRRASPSPGRAARRHRQYRPARQVTGNPRRGTRLPPCRARHQRRAGGVPGEEPIDHEAAHAGAKCSCSGVGCGMMMVTPQPCFWLRRRSPARSSRHPRRRSGRRRRWLGGADRSPRSGVGGAAVQVNLG